MGAFGFLIGAGHHVGSDADEGLFYVGLGGVVQTFGGNDWVGGVLGYLHTYKTWGNLTVAGAFGSLYVQKTGWGDVSVYGVAGWSKIDHWGVWGDVRVFGAGGGVEIYNHGWSGNVTVGGAYGFVNAHNYNAYGSVHFYGFGNTVNLVKGSGIWGDVLFAGAANVAYLGNWGAHGNIYFYGVSNICVAERGGWVGNIHYAGVANIVSLNNYALYGDISVLGVQAFLSVNRVGLQGNVDVVATSLGAVVRSHVVMGDLSFVGLGVANVISHQVAYGDLSVTAFGGFNVVHRSGAGRADIFLLGGNNVIISTGSAYVKATVIGGHNYVSVGDGGSEINAYGAFNVILTGKGVDHITSYGAFAVIKSGGAPQHQTDQVKVLGIFSHVDMSEGHGDSGGHSDASVEQRLEQLQSNTNIQDSLPMFNLSSSLVSSEDESMLLAHDVDIAQELDEVQESTSLGQLKDQDSAPQANSISAEEQALAEQLGHDVGQSDEVAPDSVSANAYQQHVAAARGLTSKGASVAEQRLANDAYGDARLHGEGDHRHRAQQDHDDSQDHNQDYNQAYVDAEKDAEKQATGVLGPAFFTEATDINRYWMAGLGGAITTTNEADTVIGTSIYNEIHTRGGDDDIFAFALVNNIHAGSGNDLAIIGGFGNYADMGDGDDVAIMLGVPIPFPFPMGVNVAQMGNGNDLLVGISAFNVALKDGDGSFVAVLAGLANVLLQRGGRAGDTLTAVLIGGLNVVHKEGDGNTIAVCLGALNTVSQRGNGYFTAILLSAFNVSTHIGDGDYRAIMVGIGNVSTKIGDGYNLVVMLGTLCVHTTIGNGNAVYVMGNIAGGNVLTKIGDGDVIAAMGGAAMANIITVIGDGSFIGAVFGGANVTTKIGDGNYILSSLGVANISTRIGDGLNVVVLVGWGNITTIIGDGLKIEALFGQANVSVIIGDGDNYFGMLAVPISAALGVPQVPSINVKVVLGKVNMAGLMATISSSESILSGNVLVKIGDGDVAVAMLALHEKLFKEITSDQGKPSIGGNVLVQIGDGRSFSLMLGSANIFVKVGGGILADHGWGVSNDSEYERLLSEHDSHEDTAAYADTVLEARDAISGFRISNINIALGFANVMVDVNPHAINNDTVDKQLIMDTMHEISASGGDIDEQAVLDNLKNQLRHSMAKHTISVMAALGGMGNVMVKVGDGTLYSLSITNIRGVREYFKDIKEQTKDGLSSGYIPSLFNMGAGGDTSGPSVGEVMDFEQWFKDVDLDELQESTDEVKKSQLQKNGNITVHIGIGDTNSLNIGAHNLIVKIGEGDLRAIMLGDNNIAVHVGNGSAYPHKHFAIDGIRVMFGDRNVIVNIGVVKTLNVVISPGFDLAEMVGDIFDSFTSSPDTDLFGRPVGEDHNAGLNVLKPNFLQGIFAIQEEGFGKIMGDLDAQKQQANTDQKNKKREKDKKNTLDADIPTGNLVISGKGTDIIIAAGKTNVIFSDTVTSIFDLNAWQIWDVNGENTFIRNAFGKDTWLGQIAGKLFGTRSQLLSNIPIIGSLASSLNINLGVFSMLPSTEIGNLLGLNTSELDGYNDIAISGQQAGAEWANHATGTLYFEIGTPRPFEALNGTVMGFVNYFSQDVLGAAYGAPGYSQDESDSEALPGWNYEGRWVGISVIPVMEILTAINKTNFGAQEVNGEYVGGQRYWDFFWGPDTTVAEDALWRNSAEWLKGTNFFHDDSDLILATGTTNLIFSGQDSDMVAVLGGTNIVALGSGYDVALVLGGDNRVAGNAGNDVILSIGAKNVLLGGDGHDLLVSIGQYNGILGGSGDNLLVSIGDGNFVYDGGGNSQMFVLGNKNLLWSGDGDDFIAVAGFNNVFYTAGGIDLVINLGFASQSFFGGGGDIVYAAGGHNAYNGEAGDDTFYMANDSQYNTIVGGIGGDKIYLGGRNNKVYGHMTHPTDWDKHTDTFVFREEVESVEIMDPQALNTIVRDKLVVTKSIDFSELWLTKQGDDLTLYSHNHENVANGIQENIESKLVVHDFFASNIDLYVFDGDMDAYRQYSANQIIDLASLFQFVAANHNSHLDEYHQRWGWHDKDLDVAVGLQNNLVQVGEHADSLWAAGTLVDTAVI